jgi:hypothetical protein
VIRVIKNLATSGTVKSTAATTKATLDAAAID